MRLVNFVIRERERERHVTRINLIRDDLQIASQRRHNRSERGVVAYDVVDECNQCCPNAECNNEHCVVVVVVVVVVGDACQTNAKVARRR